MPWIFYYSDEKPIDIITFHSHPFSINTYLTVFPSMAGLNPTIYHDAVIANAFHPFLLPYPCLVCKIPCWLMPVFPPKAAWVSVVWATPWGHVHVSAPYWVGPTAHLWRASWPCLLWCGNKKAGHVPPVMGTGELILPCSQEWRQKHGCRRIGFSFAGHHTWRGGGDLAHTRLTNSVIIQVQIQGPE